MLILLPPSEAKTAPSGGGPVDLDSLLGSRILGAARRHVMEELARVSGGDDGAAILGLGPRSAQDISANLALEGSPCAPAHDLYAGVLFDAARLGELAHDPRAQFVLSDHVVIISGLWGVLRATDRIPDHRLSMGANLPATGRLASFWRPHLSEVLNPLARGVVVDCRSGAYSPAWQPRGSSGCTLLRTRVLARRPDGGLRVVSHAAKHTRGLLAGALARALASQQLGPRAQADDIVRVAQGLPEVAQALLADADSAGRRDLTLILA